MDSLADFERECFFIAPLGEEGGGVRTRSDLILEFIVRPAAQELGLWAVRGDELAAPGQITHRVIDHVLHARTAIADLTGRNPNVYYELAVRHMAQLPVALIVAADEQPLPFDIQQMNVIRFDHRDLKSADQCRRSIVRHLSAGLGGVVDSPITAVREMAQLSTENKIDQAVSELLGRMKETFYDNATSRPAIADMIRTMDMPRSRKTERNVEVALEAVLNKAADQTRGALFVEVDPGPLVGHAAQAWLLRYDGKQTVTAFLKNILFKLTKEIPLALPGYGSAWVLRDAGTGEELFARTRDNGTGGPQKDERPIAEAGVLPGMCIEAARPRRPTEG